MDLSLGKEHKALFRRAELKTLVDFHGNEVLCLKQLSLTNVLSCAAEFGSLKMQAGKGGELTRDETTIIGGALELTEKVARDAMTPISETFAIDINANLDRFTN